MAKSSSVKYVLLVPDGMADRPLNELGGKTPMQVAKKPNMDFLAANGRVGMVQTIPEGMDPGSDVAAMSLLGYDPRKYYTGRGPIEAVSMEIPLEKKDVAFRCNLVTSDGNTMIDYSGGHVSTEQARELMAFVEEKLGTQKISFYPGVSYRHIMVWRDGSPDVKTHPPHNIIGQPIKDYLPQGDGDSTLRQLIFDSLEILDSHPINQWRRDNGKLAANMIWPWGQGRSLDLPSFSMKTGLTGAVVAAVDLVKGLGRAAGLKAVNVPGATGYLDTNFEGKAQYALDALKERDFVFLHVEAPDEAGHNGDIDAKVQAIENVDKRTLGPLLEGMKEFERFRILVSPDHVTPISIRTHAEDPVPFAVFSSFEPNETNLPFDERAIPDTKLRVEEGFRLIELLLAI
ncbi:MAG TPA: cofactor-independent phosphoglycerate mutase [Armatimonadota bacterium]|nr:cofactor-independent phosphoglycerate mutase [Armatimonadota bacterium]